MLSNKNQFKVVQFAELIIQKIELKFNKNNNKNSLLNKTIKNRINRIKIVNLLVIKDK